MAVVPVLPGLYLGSAAPGQPERAAREVGVSALLVVDSEPPEAEAVAGFEEVLHVEALDQPESDLLSCLDSSIAFIGRARERGGGVLVRCQAGVSRSVAVVTAYLMKASNLCFEEACAFIQAIKPDAKMNEGFEWQLKLYEKMGCEVDVTSALYKQYHLQKVTERYPAPQDLPEKVFAVDPNDIQQAPNCEVLYKCRKCRRRLFRSSSILSHDEGKGPAVFAHKRFSEPAPFHCNGRSSCTSYFIEPLQWMEPVLLGVMEGPCLQCWSKRYVMRTTGPHTGFTRLIPTSELISPNAKRKVPHSKRSNRHRTTINPSTAKFRTQDKKKQMTARHRQPRQIYILKPNPLKILPDLLSTHLHLLPS